MPSDPAVSLRGLSRTFGSGDDAVRAVDGVDLDVADGEFFSMLGPSGSGKTTVLRLVAGFERPTAGTVHLSGVDVTRRPPFQRDVNTVFQDYALFPHLDVLGNVEYGLRVRGVPRAQRRERAQEALAGVRLEGYGGRRPGQLSGGQRQRVALARALVNRPGVLLLDEPLGALDLQLRQRMQVELKDIQRRAGVTFVLVTHDQEEALTMSDRVAVFSRGRIEQVGPPAEVYERPATAFIAGFVGASNLIEGGAARGLLGPGTWSVRPERIRVRPVTDAGREPPPSDDATVRATGVVLDVVYAGATARASVALDAGGRLTAHVPPADSPHGALAPGSRVTLAWDRPHAHRLPDPQTDDQPDRQEDP